MNRIKILAVLLPLLASAACGRDLNVPDLNQGSLNGLQSNPSASGIATAAQGLLVGLRASAGDNVVLLGIMGREGYDLDPSNPEAPTQFYRNVSEDLAATIWEDTYSNMRQEDIILGALPKVPGLTDAQREATRGFVETIQAIDLLYTIEAVDDAGAAVDINPDPTGTPEPIVPKAQVYTRIDSLLDDALTHLGKGDAFPFNLGPGFTGFNTPASFATFNRAIRARADIFQQDYSSALKDLAASFLDTTQPLTLGTYHIYSENSGDQLNPIFDALPRQRFPHASLWAGAQLRADGSKDLRAQAKLKPVSPFARFGYTVSENFEIYNSDQAPVPIIRNEELILDRAEAELGTGNRAAAIADLNFIRTTSGGLDPLPASYSGDLVTELLYNRLYSLMWEGGFRWLDARRFGRLAQLPHDLPGDLVFPRLAIPADECNARAPNKPAGCQVPAGM